jgi:hypothetical protein
MKKKLKLLLFYKKRNFGQRIWDEVWCYWEHIGNTKYPKMSIHETKESENEGTHVVITSGYP